MSRAGAAAVDPSLGASCVRALNPKIARPPRRRPGPSRVSKKYRMGSLTCLLPRRPSYWHKRRRSRTVASRTRKTNVLKVSTRDKVPSTGDYALFSSAEASVCNSGRENPAVPSHARECRDIEASLSDSVRSRSHRLLLNTTGPAMFPELKHPSLICSYASWWTFLRRGRPGPPKIAAMAL
jgi:hypothetical protein